MLHAVIMAGGSGTRFWPLSRETHPKQFLTVSGKESLLKQTFDRIEPLSKAERIYIVTNPRMGVKCLSQLPDFRKRNLILEPVAKNTAPAIGLAAFRLRRVDPEAVMLVLAADHYIENRDAFLKIVKRAHKAALMDFLVTLGIRPTRAETGYGYIQKAERTISLKGGGTVYPVHAFKEKPDLSTAERYVREGGYYWNSGMFVWKVSVILKEMETFMPSLFEKLSEMDQLPEGADHEKKREEIFGSLAPESIDYGIMEKSKKVVVVPSDFRWHDVGSLSNLDEINPADDKGNLMVGNVLGLENRDSIFHGGDRLIAAIGLKDMMVVDTPDATLVCPKARAQEVKKLAEKLKQEGRPEFMEPRAESFPWGRRTLLDVAEGYAVWKVEVHPGEAPALHGSSGKDPQWVLLSGTGMLHHGKKETLLAAGQSFFISQGTSHRLENRGRDPLVALEIQIPRTKDI